MPIKFEYTARNAPQQNHLAEIGIYVIYCRGRALMSRANSPKKYHYRMFWLATETACVLDWLTLVTINGVMATKIKHFSNSIPVFVNHLQTFGEAGVVTIAGTIKKKVDMRGLLCLMGGYCTDRAGDCYKMYDPINNNVYFTRGVLWLNKMYLDKNGEIDSLPDISADSAPAAPVAQTLTQVPDKQAGIRRTKTKNKSCLKDISFPVPNGENDDASIVSRKQQHAASKTDNDIDIDFEVDNGSDAESEGDVDDVVNPEEDDSSEEDEAPTRPIIDGHTRSGRSFKNLRSIDKPTRSSQHRGHKDDHKVRKEALLAQLAKRLAPAEIKFCNSIKDLKELSLLSAEILSDEGRYVEIALVGAAGNKFGNTADLNVLNYKQSMESQYRDRYVEGIDK
jgi:hypothetical protein